LVTALKRFAKEKKKRSKEGKEGAELLQALADSRADVLRACARVLWCSAGLE
jgi:hypothetical protein